MLLITLGDLSLDIVIAAASPIATGSDVGGTVAFRIGGSAANVARAYAQLGGSAVFIGAVGDDRVGRRLVRALRDAGVRPRAVVVPDEPTARIAVLLSASGERSFVAARGAADGLAPEALRAGWFRRIGALHLPAYSLLSQPLGAAAALAASWAHRFGGLVSVDLASAQPLHAAGPARARAAVAALAPDVLFANADEAAALGGNASDLAPVVVIKLGADGCRVGDVHVPTERLQATDTTGAGDAFDAGFLRSWLSEGAHAERAARAGHAAARALLSAPRPELEL